MTHSVPRLLPTGCRGLEPSAWPAGWQMVQLKPAHVSEHRRVQGQRRIKTDAIDLEAITELLLAVRARRSPHARRRWPS